MVEDKTHGFRIDLMPLAEFGVQTITLDDFEYDVAVCRPLPASYPCGSDTKGTSVCRRSLADKRDATPLGAASSTLIYNGGLVTVVYADANESSNIAFHCDFTAGVGSCVVQASDKQGHLYDLSRLTRVRPDRDWVFETADPNTSSARLRFYVSLCRPLRRPPPKCGPLASVCVETLYANGTRTVVDAGHAVGPPILDKGQLMLNYSNGAECLRRGQNSTVRTILHFQCDDEREASGEFLQYIGKLDECGYSFLWTTEAACPIRHQPVKDECAVVDRLTGDVFNASHLQSDTFYRSGNYEFNICGPIRNSTNCPGDNVSVCHITIGNDGKKRAVALAGAAGYQLVFGDADTLRLSYMGESAGERTTRVEIELVCTTAAKKNVIEPRGSFGDGQVHRISFYSSGVCPRYRNDPTSCEVINSKTGHVYDLRPLAHGALSNWEAVEYSPVSYDFHYRMAAKQKYYFNVCKKLNQVPVSEGGYNCPKGSYACATSTEHPDRMGESLGRYLENILFGEDGIIGIRYVGGDKCPSQRDNAAGNASQGETEPNFKSTLITLACTPNDHETPKIIKNSKDCDYVFYMETPAACPVKKVMGSDCKVTEPNFGYEFDLSELGGRNKVYTVTNADDKGMHKLSVCGPLPDASALCGGDQEAGSCLIGTNGKNISLGKGTAALQYDTGILTLIYSDGVPGCADPKENRSTTIHFLCDHSAKVGSTAPEVDAMDDNCGFVFRWYTELACAPRTEQTCKVDTPDGLVDLTPLSQPRLNYVTPDNLVEVGQKYVINVCRSVVHMRALTCGFSSGACVINGDSTVNLGVVANGPFYVKDEHAVRIRYRNGDQCSEGLPPSVVSRWSTLIDFVCDHQDSGPVHMTNEKCEARFAWHTPHACPQSRELHPAKNQTCTAVHPVGNTTVIDLHSLVRADSESPYAVHGPAGGMFKLNICGAARETSCGADTGICFENRHEVHKIAPPSSHLVWDEGVLAMVFEGGDSCGLASEDQPRKMRAIIHFVCPSASFGRDAPQFVSQSPDDCEYRFVWPTELACLNVLRCAHNEEQELFDLSPLSARSHRARNILDTGYEYYVSVCRPLEPQRPYLSMPPNAAIVRVATNSRQAESLGHAFLEPFTDFQQSLSLLYVNGSRCEWDSAQLNKARISFECDYAQDAGEPVLVDIDQAECLYVFRWRTNLVCAGSADAHQVNPRRNCKFPVLQRGISLDLALLAKKSPYQIKVNSPDGGDSGHFTLSVCKDLPVSTSGCRNAELCFTSKEQGSVRNISYGVADSFHYQGGVLFVRYTGGDKCISMLSKPYSAIVAFECDPLYEPGTPVVEKHYACVTVFRWKTVHACSAEQLRAAEGGDCLVRHGSSVFDLTMLSSVSHVWTLNEPQSQSTFYLNVCGISHRWPLDALDKCSGSGVCLERHVHENVSEFSSLGDYRSRTMTVEDGGTVRITYNGGDPSVCPLTGQHPTTIIDMKCDLVGDSVGTPKLVAVPTSTSCTHRFLWPSRYACAEATDVLVVQKGGYLIDPRIHRAYNLTALFNRTFRTVEYRHGQDNYTYRVNLQELCRDSSCRINWRTGPCAESAVCQTKRSTFMKNIGSASHQRFYLRGSELLLVIDTNATCLHVQNATIKSIFTFACDHEAGIGVPSFVYETKSCHYIFSWRTEYVCPSRVEHPAMAWSQMGDGGTAGSGSTMSVIIVLSFLAVVLAGLLMFLSKPDNRLTVRARTLRIFRTVTMPHYYYSKTESEMQSPLDNDGDTVLLSPSLVLQPDDDDFSSPLA
ncbi:cation-independent mannose-6-phosphate receptor-like [Tropilaelaps mercedesae]|uniref:Cation-independent mannose-6-phosphate receptor-like n=1 Tax=Tropilaelaps mercedesae TaxID=418985 RepID=A0A1V9X8H5_9ACAR|nr:cation-independent mannose-6-phosphate receptor-like [Tropilaelaps mercedesae]